MTAALLVLVLGLADAPTAKTKFTSLDEALKDPGAVRELDLSRRNLEKLPPEIGRLTNLVSLNLYGNRLHDLPDSIASLDHLEELVLAHNAFTALPPPVAKLAHLRRLDASYNPIAALPDWIGDLSALEALEVESARLTAIPASVGRLHELERLVLESNPLASMPSTIQQRGYLSVLLTNTPIGKTGWAPPPAPQPPPTSVSQADPAALRATLQAVTTKDALYTVLRQQNLLPTIANDDHPVFRPRDMAVDLFHANLFEDAREEKILQLRFRPDPDRDGVFILAFYTPDKASDSGWRRVWAPLVVESKRFTFSLIPLRVAGESALVGDEMAPALPDDNLKQTSRLLRIWQVTLGGVHEALAPTTLETEAYLSASGEQVAAFARTYHFVPPGAQFPKKVRLDRKSGQTPRTETLDLSFVAP